MSQTRQALIIGGTGFISSYCVEVLAGAGFAVSILTRGQTPDIHGDRVKCRIPVDCRKRSEFVRTLEGSLDVALKAQGLAAQGDAGRWSLVVDCICYEATHAEDVVAGLLGRVDVFVDISTDSIYEVCEPAPAAVLLTKGTTEEFDSTLLVGKDEADLRRLDEYGYEKWECEQVFKEAFAARAFPVVMLRLPDVLGEREYSRSRHFQYQMRMMLGLPVYVDPDRHGASHELPAAFAYTNASGEASVEPRAGSAPPLLSFVHAGDVAAAALACWRAVMGGVADGAAGAKEGQAKGVAAIDEAKGCTRPPVLGQAFNIASPEQLTFRDYLRVIGAAVDAPPRFFSTQAERKALLYGGKSRQTRAGAGAEGAAVAAGPAMTDATEQAVSATTGPECRGYAALAALWVSAEPARAAPRPLASGVSVGRLLQLVRGSEEGKAAGGTPPGTGSDRTAAAAAAAAAAEAVADAARFSERVLASGYELSSDSSDSDSDSSDDNSSDNDGAEATAKRGKAAAAPPPAASGGVPPLRERETDMTTYLPSVSRGPICIDKALRALPGWRPRPLVEWLTRASVWYAAAATAGVMRSDPLAKVRLEVRRLRADLARKAAVGHV